MHTYVHICLDKEQELTIQSAGPSSYLLLTFISRSDTETADQRTVNVLGQCLLSLDNTHYVLGTSVSVNVRVVVKVTFPGCRMPFDFQLIEQPFVI